MFVAKEIFSIAINDFDVYKLASLAGFSLYSNPQRIKTLLVTLQQQSGNSVALTSFKIYASLNVDNVSGRI